MFITKLTCGCVLVALVCSATGLAQQSFDSNGLPPVGYRPDSPYPPHLGEAYHHDSTAAGNYQRGAAAVIYANGSYWLSVSQAAILFEYARSLDTYNRRQWIELGAWNRRRLDNERQHGLETKRIKNESTRLARYSAAYRLMDEELDQRTGKIAWPKALQTAEYAVLRTRIEESFHEPVTTGTVDGNAHEIPSHVEALRRLLRRNVNEVTRDEYVAARRFLLGLKYDRDFETHAADLSAAQTNSALGVN